MKNSTLKRIQSKIRKLPVYFVDSSIFLEILLKQSKYDECISFFNNVGYRYRLMASTVVMGEIIKALHELGDERQKEGWLSSLSLLLENSSISILPVSFQCINNIPTVMNAESHLESSDAIIFSSAITENCRAFITLDSDFSMRLETEFDILIKKPSDA